MIVTFKQKQTLTQRRGRLQFNLLSFFQTERKSRIERIDWVYVCGFPLSVINGTN